MTQTGLFDFNYAYSFPPGINPDQVLSYDGVNDTLLLTETDGSYTGWSTFQFSPSQAAVIAEQPDKEAYINTTLGYVPVNVEFVGGIVYPPIQPS